MIIEKQIEDLIRGKFDELAIEGLEVTGAWKMASEGEIKGSEGNSPAYLAVAVSPHSYETFTVPHCDVRVALALSVRRDACPSGAGIATFYEPISTMIDDWQMGSDETLSSLSTTNFKCYGVMVSSGDGPAYNRERGTWEFTHTLTLRGHIEREA